MVHMMISILIPTKNEPLINDLIEELHKQIKQHHEIVVVDKSDKSPFIKNARYVRQKSDGLGLMTCFTRL